ncbi:hypothetical protein BRADI_1g26300v3 [Brachypodium distachyon]|uniref:RRM domain-containing protein n=1 Tax=Brachypodium distachyon TaxID=15368 RepID=A0A0Q3GYE1_BRADI|nr:hypothetical protein BRADI_1g26300v3 [Brachypodium distachyon]
MSLVQSILTMDYISPERNLDGTCGDPGSLFADQDGSLLEHLDYHGDGSTQHDSPPLNDELLVDQADQISYLAANSIPYMNDQVSCNTMKSASTSPPSPLKQDKEYKVHMESDMQNNAAEQNVHRNDPEAHTTSPGYAVQHKTDVVDAVLPPELHESSGNDTSDFQQEATHSDAYLGDSMLTQNSSRDYQLNNSGDDDDEIPNSSALQMENVDIRKLHKTFHNEVNGTEDNQMNGGNSNSHDERDSENLNSVTAPSYLDGMEQEEHGGENGISTPGNQWDSPCERSAELEKDTPSPDRRVSLSVERSPHTHSSEKLDSLNAAKEDEKLAHSRSPPARRQPRSPEKHDTHRRRASSRDLSPHARENSPERKARKDSRHGVGSPRRRSASPRRRGGTPRRRSASPRRRDGSPRRRSTSPKRRDRSPRRRSPSPKKRDRSPRRRSPSPKRRSSPKRRGSPRRKDSPPRKRDSSPRRRDSSPKRRDSSPRRRDSPTRKRDRSKSRSPSRKTDTSRHRREHVRSRSRSPHSRDHHKRSPRRRHSPRHRSPPASHRQHSPRRPWSPPANRKTGLGKPGRNLFVAGFSYATTERDLEKKFAKYGRVTSVRVVRDKRTGDSRGFGFLCLEKDEDADAAIQACDETEWNGRIILVEKSKAPSW